ncbi:drug/metabolite transporter (DMT)-like permease [Fontibacillus phaseoli]|uniref:Drug/metabolite transporter (DMT)-like permease n=1 Tax=Fontibacillus phaseoli TaxID=1416533 RepID=A0A369BJN0_9BACL|nr:DMT family transporter [Fontibacillus phaseoli]RCX20647.1 drug/metabolite transporter (DMT)-like permease [Fontibacillus phaseoli]
MILNQGKIYLFLAFSLAGTSVIAARLVSDHIGPFTITALSLLLGLLILVPLYRIRLIAAIKRMTFTDWKMVVLQAFFGIFLFRALLLAGLHGTSAGEAGLLTGAAPAITALMAWLFLRERLTVGILAGTLFTVTGILLIQWSPSSGYLFLSGHLGGNLLVLGAAASESLFNTLSRAGSRDQTRRDSSVDPIVQTTLVTIAAFVFAVIPAFMEHPLSGLSDLGLTGWLSLLWYGWVVTVLAFICWYAGIKRTSTYTAAAYSGMMPLTSMLLSLGLLNESVSYAQAVGGLAVILGMWFIGRQPGKNASRGLEESADRYREAV